MNESLSAFQRKARPVPLVGAGSGAGSAARGRARRRQKAALAVRGGRSLSPLWSPQPVPARAGAACEGSGRRGADLPRWARGDLHTQSPPEVCLAVTRQTTNPSQRKGRSGFVSIAGSCTVPPGRGPLASLLCPR